MLLSTAQGNEAIGSAPARVAESWAVLAGALVRLQWVERMEANREGNPDARLRGVAQKLGFEKRRRTGRHERWNHPDGRSVTIPLHGGREIGPPLFGAAA